MIENENKLKKLLQNIDENPNALEKNELNEQTSDSLDADLSESTSDDMIHDDHFTQVTTIQLHENKRKNRQL